MYIEGNDEKLPGYKAEKVVLNAIKDCYGESAIAIHHFPMFNDNGKTHKEIDVLLINRDLGLIAIEVKGILINQISKITGHNWYYNNFYVETGNPYEQVRNQVDMLGNFLEKDPILYHRFSKRALVALPYITSDEWQSKNFENEISLPPIIFKDDLKNPVRLKEKIQKATLREYFRRMSTLQWQQLQKKLGIDIPSSSSSESKSRSFSTLYIINTTKDFLDYKIQIENELQSGIKVYILAYIDLSKYVSQLFSKNSNQDIEEYKKEFQFLYFLATINNNPLTKQVINNGKMLTTSENLISHIRKDFPSFNLDQYLAVHYDTSKHEIITAGAGTGKTHVMVDRILYLLLHEKVKLSSIDMITFTNESTNEMKSRLERRLITLHKLTKQPKFLIFAEEVTDMTISTIHKYAKSILKRLSHEIGYGQGMSVSSFIVDKKLVIEGLLDQFLTEEKLKEFIKSEIPTYELVNIIYDIWNKMEVKGLSTDEIVNLDWGVPNNEIAAHLQTIFTYIFSHCEEKLEEIKKKKNAISTGDLIRKLKQFTEQHGVLSQLPNNRFVFIDEFQDSDPVQIELFASLANNLDYKLFVVGDLKQSIYRFRGADYKSFKELIKKLEPNNVMDISLRQSYRSTSTLLKELHSIFEKWSEMNLLEYNSEDDKLHSFKSSAFKESIQVGADISKMIEAALLNTGTEEDKVALIVRTNKQARLVKEICNKHRIATSENLDGTFYISDTVIHFNILVKALLFPNEPKYLIELLQTPYFGYDIPFQQLIEFNGDKEALTEYINSMTNNLFSYYVRSLKTKSFLAIFHEIVKEHNLFGNLKHFYKKKENNKKSQIEYSINKYERNLQHLITQIEKNVDPQNTELFTIEKWLTIQIQTNRKENEPSISGVKTQVEITTVHRSKGLEYHTVIIPYTHLQFTKFETDFYFQEEPDDLNSLNNRRIGWQIDKSTNKKTAQYGNEHHKDLLDLHMSETEKEEARLLYVAMTRAVNQIYIVMKKRNLKNTWAGLLNSGGIYNK